MDSRRSSSLACLALALAALGCRQAREHSLTATAIVTAGEIPVAGAIVEFALMSRAELHQTSRDLVNIPTDANGRATTTFRFASPLAYAKWLSNEVQVQALLRSADGEALHWPDRPVSYETQMKYTHRYPWNGEEWVVHFNVPEPAALASAANGSNEATEGSFPLDPMENTRLVSAGLRVTANGEPMAAVGVVFHTTPDPSRFGCDVNAKVTTLTGLNGRAQLLLRFPDAASLERWASMTPKPQTTVDILRPDAEIFKGRELFLAIPPRRRAGAPYHTYDTVFDLGHTFFPVRYRSASRL